MSDKNIKNDSLTTHNKYRKDHGAPPLKWSKKLENNAQKWANELAKKGSLQHASQNEEGENLSYTKGKDLTGKYACEMWYDEIKDYNFNNPGFRHGTGHFTQVVWVGSEELGVAKATSPDGKQFVVARYYPPGNNTRTFRENVFPKGTKMQSRKPSEKAKSPKANTTKPGKVKESNKPNTTTRTVTTTEKVTVTVKTGGSSTTTTNAHASSERQSDGEFRKSVLRTHNMYRKRHAVAPLKWNSKLAKAAADAAQEAANTNTLRALDMDNVGQNMIARSHGELPGQDVSSVWYNEESKYNYGSPGFSSATGKFTQMVWKETKEVGIGRAFGSQGQTFVIALYQPPGNARGKYEENVISPKGPVPTDPGSGCGCVIL